MNWFRLYVSVLEDPKVQRLSAETFRGWINVLCLARRHGGTLPAAEDVAWALRLTEQDAQRLLDNLHNAGLLDGTETGLCPHNWNNRQYNSDSSAERMRRFRAKKRAHQTSSEPEQIQNRYRTDTEQSKSRHLKRHGDGLCNVTHEADVSFASDFWPIYPRKIGKLAALKTWKRKATSEAKRTEILEGLRARLPELQARELQYIPHASTWLNQERWKEPIEDNSRPGAGRQDRHAIHDQRVSETFDALVIRRLERGKQLQ